MNMKKLLLFLVAAVTISAVASAASDVTVGNFVFNGPATFNNETCYNLKRLSDAGKTVTGQLVVPGYVMVSGTRYRVRSIDGLGKTNGGQYSSVKVEYGVENITRETFRDVTTLTSVSLPSSIKEIGQMTFSGCSNLTRLYYAGESLMDVQQYTFQGTPSTKYLYTATRRGANALKANSTWNSAFSSIVCNPTVAYDFNSNGVAYVIKKGIPYNYGSCAVAIVGGNPTNNGKVTLNQNINSGLTNSPGSYPIREVADSAFYHNTNVKTVANNLFYGYKIGKNAFDGCTNLTSVDLAVDSIYAYAFYGCTALTSITLHAPGDGGGPGGVRFLGNYAFGRVGATSVSLPSCLETVQTAPFYYCPSLTEISVNSSNTKFASYLGCLYSKDYSTLYQIPGGLTDTQFHPNLQYALSYCGYKCVYHLLSFPYGMKSIGSYAFSTMPNLLQVCLPSSLTSVSTTAFAGTSGISEIYLNQVTPPSSDIFPALTKGNVKLYVPYDGYDAYRLHSVWRNYNIQYANSDWDECYDFADGNYYTVTSSTEVSLVRPNRSATTVNIPNTVTRNGKTYKVTAIGPFAFYDGPTSNFTVTVNSGTNLKTVREKAFFNNTYLKSFPFESITRIENSAFSGTTGMTSQSVNLTAAEFIDEYAFSGSYIESVTTGKQLTSLGGYAFSNCVRLGSATFSNSSNLNHIPSHCFDGCTILNHFYGQYSDYGTTTIFSYAFKNSALVGHVTMPTGTKTIYDNAFEGSKLKDLELPYGTNYVGNNAFLNCTQLTRLVMPATVTTIKPSFIKGCTAITQLVLNQRTPISLWSASGNDYVNYLNAPSDLTVYVPVGCVSAYTASSSPWQSPNTGNYTGCIKEGAYDFCSRSNGFYDVTGFKFDVLEYPSSSNSYFGNARLVYNPTTINKQQDVIANNVLDASGHPFHITAVGNKAFYNSTALKSFKYTAYLTEIGEYAFYNSALTSLIFEEVATSVSSGLVSPYVEKIGQYAFYNCANLKELMFDRRFEAYSAASLGKRFFGNNHSSFKFYVDYHFYDQYATILTNWNDNEVGRSKLYPYTKMSSTYQTIACSEALAIPSGMTCYRPTKYNSSANQVYLVETDILCRNTGAILKGTVDKYYKFSYPSTYQGQISLMQPVLGSNQYINSNSTNARFSLNGGNLTFEKITSSTLFKTGNAYLELAVSNVGNKTTVGYTFTDPGSGGQRSDLNGDGNVNTGDVSVLYKAILNGWTDSKYDINGDGNVNTGDVSELYKIILGN